MTPGSRGASLSREWKRGQRLDVEAHWLPTLRQLRSENDHPYGSNSKKTLKCQTTESKRKTTLKQFFFFPCGYVLSGLWKMATRVPALLHQTWQLKLAVFTVCDLDCGGICGAPQHIQSWRIDIEWIVLPPQQMKQAKIKASDLCWAKQRFLTTIFHVHILFLYFIIWCCLFFKKFLDISLTPPQPEFSFWEIFFYHN